MDKKNSYSYVVSARIVEVLTKWMEKVRLSQGGLAQELGTSQSAVQRWLNTPGIVARGDAAKKLEELINKISSDKEVSVDTRVYSRIKKHKETCELSSDSLAEFLDMDLVECVTCIERCPDTVEFDTYIKLINGYIKIVESEAKS